ncbi:ST3 beta-galactoside alpha-2,3-sialyltransferase 8 isoform X2 [Lampris incognitus]|uniref:ST3 beta-galactoside alpha-2,3-sialyltransferase 8 isoform X2 n=1 Tax=Lampris incognitus TaxID=2546036 RepID=UPI0024B4BEC2|nr:ST3 beta-galactoside alpha-2,3-sialyltransferase 8 isoform X2 [Lampris incognitus]
MLLRRKLYVAVLFAAILFLMIASQTIHRSHFLSVVMPTGQNMPTRGGSCERSGETGLISAAGSSSGPPRAPTAPTAVQSQGQDPMAGAEPAGDPQAGEESLGKSQTKPKASGKLCGCTDGCISDLGGPGSDWFRQRYDPQQQPVLHQSDHNMDPDALRWWLGLQRSNDGQTLEEVMSKMFQVISPPTLQLRPLPSRCRSCAVVGNSGNLQGSTHGKLIDSHTSVIRMNKAVTVGFEQDVGNRTTHHFLYPESAVDVGGGVSLVLLPFKLRDLEWLTSALSTGQITMTYMRVKDRVQADKDKVLVVNPVFFKYAHEHWTERHGRYPSTGMLALIFALHTCDQVSVFGYGADQEGNWHHYWEENRYAGAFRKTGVHSAEFETQVIHRLAKDGKINLHL